MNKHFTIGTASRLVDLQGSLLGLTDPSGNVIKSYSYTPYGDSTATYNADGLPGSSFLWKGAELEANAVTGYNDNQGNDFLGFDIYQMGSRYYGSTIGRFYSRDPLGFAASSNVYLFGGDDPVNNSDPTGMDEGDIGAYEGQASGASASADVTVPAPSVGGFVVSVGSYGFFSSGSIQTNPVATPARNRDGTSLPVGGPSLSFHRS